MQEISDTGCHWFFIPSTSLITNLNHVNQTFRVFKARCKYLFPRCQTCLVGVNICARTVDTNRRYYWFSTTPRLARTEMNKQFNWISSLILMRNMFFYEYKRKPDNCCTYVLFYHYDYEYILSLSIKTVKNMRFLKAESSKYFRKNVFFRFLRFQRTNDCWLFFYHKNTVSMKDFFLLCLLIAGYFQF